METGRTWYTTAEVATRLGIAHSTVRNAINNGTLESEQINPRLRMVSAEAVERYRSNHLGRRGRPPRRQPAQKGTNHQSTMDDQKA